MLLPYTRLLDTPVMSLQTGAELARTKDILIDPRNLTIIAYELVGHMLDTQPSYLRPADIRELSNLGFIVDSSDEFVGLDDVIVIRQVYDFGFSINGIEVHDEKNHKLGKVESYVIDSGSYSVQQIVVKRPLLKSFNESELTIHRSQVVEVTNDRITVKSATIENPARSESFREYSNPFRKTSPQPESFESWK